MRFVSGGYTSTPGPFARKNALDITNQMLPKIMHILEKVKVKRSCTALQSIRQQTQQLTQNI